MISSDQFREAMSRYPTGVTVVTAKRDGRVYGITANSFASVSLDPPLVLWSVGKHGDRGAVFAGAEAFAICFLTQDQADIASHCAEHDDLPEGKWSTNAAGLPVIDEAGVVLTCRQYAVYPGGDHDIIVGEVTDIAVADGKGALGFYKRDYGRLE
ncbi:flavin reductase family protein [Hyphobacterium sp.]|uniref:flavin reductase family protein n=1 Tax=Hyphobacterium sp. TaxID=2004662 RepID=UPI003BA956AC